jgi:hypothetical protein
VIQSADKFDLEAGRREEEIVQELREREATAMLQAAQDAARLDPQLKEFIGELIALREGGKLTADETIKLLEDFKRITLELRTKEDKRGWIQAKIRDPSYALYNRFWANERVKNGLEWLVANESNIYLAMRIVFAGYNLWAIFTWPNAILHAITFYFGGVWPWTEATNNWAEWMYSLVTTPAYYSLLGAAMLAWLYAHWNTLGSGLAAAGSALKKFSTWVVEFIRNGSMGSKESMMSAFNALPADAQASVIADFSSKVKELKNKEPEANSILASPIQQRAVTDLENQTRATATQDAQTRGSPVANVIGADPGAAELFGEADPDLEQGRGTMGSSSSSSSAASGGPGGGVGGRRRRRTKRRGTRRSTRRSSKRSKKTKRAKRSRRHR